MTVTISQLDSWKVETFRAAADITDANAGRIKTAEDAFSRAYHGVTQWDGNTHREAGLKTDEELGHCRRVRGLLAELSDTLRAAATDFEDSRNLIHRKRADARAAGHTVQDDGKVSGGKADDAEFYQQQIAGALSRASQADTRAAERLAQLGDLLARPGG